MAIALTLGIAANLAVAWILASVCGLATTSGTIAAAPWPGGYWTVAAYDAPGVVYVESYRVVGAKRSWCAEQATGAPDTPNAGDAVTAWATQGSDSGVHWLQLDYSPPIAAKEAHVYENTAPGAMTKIVSIGPGGERTLWEGTDPTPISAPSGVSKVPLASHGPLRTIRIYIDTNKSPSWNEIDAVGLVDEARRTQWAMAAVASSNYNYAYSTVESATQLLPVWSTLGTPGKFVVTGGTQVEHRGAAAFGWPFPCVAGEWDWIAVAAAKPTFAPSLSPTGPTGGGGARGTASRVPVVPIRVLPLPMLAGASLFAGAWLALIYAVSRPWRLLVEVNRVRKGCCVACGYDLRYDFRAGCPECGWLR